LRVVYSSGRLAKACSSFDLMRKEWGNDVAKALARRIKDVQATSTPDELLTLPGRWEWLRGDRTGQMSARVTANWRLIAQPRVDGTFEILTVEDYH
jgi:toxin HigB-1